MKIIFSLNTDITNTLSTRYDVFEVIMTQYFLAIQRAKKHYPDSEIILYTDTVGGELFKGLCTIKYLEKDKEVYFSESKIEAISKEEAPFIYIDGDLFIDEKLKHLPGIDLLIEHDETNIFESHYRQMFDIFTEKGIKDVFPEWGLAKHIFNVGIMGFFNEELKKKYVELFKTLKAFHKSLEGQIPKFNLVTLIIVQYSLSLLTRSQNYTYEFADNRSKYLHLYGKQKFYKKNVDWIEKECRTYKEYYSFKNKLDRYDKNSLVFRHFTNYE